MGRLYGGRGKGGRQGRQGWCVGAGLGGIIPGVSGVKELEEEGGQESGVSSTAAC